MLSFLVWSPAVHADVAAVLVYLHGAGEGFQNPQIARTGVRNLFRQGVPKVVCDPDGTLPADHPLMSGGVTLLAPQLPDRETPWHHEGHVQQVAQALDRVAPRDRRRVYLMGFSKGGRAVFQYAAPLFCRAIVAIDASPMRDDPAGVRSEISSCSTPFWAISTGYPEGHALQRIPQLHHGIAAFDHPAGRWNDLIAPATGARCKSSVPMEHEPADRRHAALCTAVATSRVPYDWLFRH